jgi:hypothetical protein
LLNLTEINSIIKLLPFIYSIIAFGIIIYIFNRNIFPINIFERNSFRRFPTKIHWFLTHKWYFDAIYNEYIIVPLMKQSYAHVFANLDKGIIE